MKIRVNMPARHLDVDPEDVLITEIRPTPAGPWEAWGRIRNHDTEVRVAYQDGNWRWQAEGELRAQAPDPVIMRKIREYVERVLLQPWTTP